MSFAIAAGHEGNSQRCRSRTTGLQWMVAGDHRHDGHVLVG